MPIKTRDVSQTVADITAWLVPGDRQPPASSISRAYLINHMISYPAQMRRRHGNPGRAHGWSVYITSAAIRMVCQGEPAPVTPAAAPHLMTEVIAETAGTLRTHPQHRAGAIRCMTEHAHTPRARYGLAAAMRMAGTDEPTCYPALTYGQARTVLYRAVRGHMPALRARDVLGDVLTDASYTAPGYGVTYCLAGAFTVHVRCNSDHSYTVTIGA